MGYNEPRTGQTQKRRTRMRKEWMGVVMALYGFTREPIMSQAVVLYERGGPMAPIVLDGPFDPALPDLSPAARRALTEEEREARRLQELRVRVINDLLYHIETMTGVRPAILDASALSSIPVPALVLGEAAVRLGAVPLYQTTMKESFRLLTRNGRVLVAGESFYGTAHGLYELLREVGCDWLFPGPEGELIPRVERLVVPPMDVAKKPAFEVRSPWISTAWASPKELADYELWKIRQQQTQSRDRRHPLFLEGGHYWAGLIQKNKKKLEEQPEMRALTRTPDGRYERNWFQLEATHPGVIEMTVEDIRETFRRNGWPNDYAVALSISPNDGGGFSESPDALAAGSGRVDPITGERDHTDELVLYINQVLERLLPEFPNLYLGMYLYGAHADYPMRYKPHPHLTVNIADITYSRYHSLLDPRSATRTYYRHVLEQWGRLHAEQGNPLSFYGYNWNLAENVMPYTKLKIWGQDLPFYYRIGVIGHNNQQDKAYGINGPHDYLMARMGWDITLDWQAVLHDYCEKAFGPAAPFMVQYYRLLAETQESAGHEAGSFGAIHLIFTREFVARARALFAGAGQAATEAFHRRNLDYFTQPVRALELYLDFREAIGRFDFPAAKAAYDALVAHHDHYLQKNPQIVSTVGRTYLTRLFIGPFVEAAVRYSTGDYRILYPVPDELPTILDPHVMGQFMGFYHPAQQDRFRMRTRTWSTTWDAQGLGPYRQGAVWYRIGFDLPSVADEEGIGFFVGGAEDEVNLWCNGVFVGRSAHAFYTPNVFDLTPHVRRGERNLVVLQVVQRSWCNELWLGGILYPCFVFAGPRLEKPAPDETPPYRVLPGGEREPVRQL
jgi:hypothetical protein